MQYIRDLGLRGFPVRGWRKNALLECLSGKGVLFLSFLRKALNRRQSTGKVRFSQMLLL